MSVPHGGLFVTAGSDAQTLYADTTTKLTGFDSEAVASEDQGELNIQPDGSNDKVTLKPGRYLALFHLSGTFEAPPSGTDEVDYPDLIVELFKAGEAYGKSLKARAPGNADSKHTHCAFQGILDIAFADDSGSGVDIDVRATLAWLSNEAAGESSESSSGGLDFTPADMSLTFLRIWD